MPITFTIKQGEETLTSHSGLALIGALLGRTHLQEKLNQVHLAGCQNPKISHADMVFAMLGLICLGKPDYEAIEQFRENLFFRQSLGIKTCPSSSALRQRIDIIKDAFDATLKKESAELIRRVAPQISPVETSCGHFVPLDIDVSPFDNSKTNKEGVSRTYKGYDGFAPIFGYLGKEGYLVNLELREGSQHCQKDTPQFITACIEYARKITNQPVLVRLDSGNDSADSIASCLAKQVEFIIKRNLRKEDPHAWLKLAMKTGIQVPCREGKKIWRGKTLLDLKGNPLAVPIVFEVTERTSKKGQGLLFPEITVDTYWSSLDLEPYETILLYHDHGTSEQFHSELKSDMDLERLPSGQFSSNACILLVGMLGYNLLRICGQESLREDNGNVERIPDLRKPAQRRRIRTVMLDLIYMAGRIIHTSRKWFISMGKTNPFASLWSAVYRRFASETA
jgi:hypothetical protein